MTSKLLYIVFPAILLSSSFSVISAEQTQNKDCAKETTCSVTTEKVNKAEEPKGAFGILFGQPLKELKIIEKSELTSGEPLYKVKAPNPFKNKISEYYVLVTPKTHLVHTIWGDQSYDYEERGKCVSLKDDIVAVLENKYGPSEESSGMNIKNNRVFSFSDSIIFVKCADLKEDFSIRYINSSLSDQADKEKKELTVSNTESDML